MQFTSGKFKCILSKIYKQVVTPAVPQNCTKQGRFFTKTLTSVNPILNEKITKRNLQKETALSCFQSKANTKENLNIFRLIIARLLNFVK